MRHLLIALLLFFNGTALAATDCSEYRKLGVPSAASVTLCRTGYLAAHDSSLKTPIWVIEHLTKAKASAESGRTNDFHPDPDLPKGQRAELADYDKTYDRGHQAPAGDMRWSEQAMHESFYLSNMVPQNPAMNRGIWRELEERARLSAIDRGEVYIVTGPIYENRDTTTGPNHVVVPTHLFKVVYDPAKNEVIAFIMPNAPLRTADTPSYQVTLRQLETKAGLNFFAALPAATKAAILDQKVKFFAR